MRAINVSIEVFAKIWSLRELGEETEDIILRRILNCTIDEPDKLPPQGNTSTLIPAGGFYDRRFNVHFQEGFEVFRNYLGTNYSARATSGRWTLLNDGSSQGSLNELSKAIGAKSENAWVNWFYRSPDGDRRAVSDLRDTSRISLRKRFSANTINYDQKDDQDPLKVKAADEQNESATNCSNYGTWRADLQEALRQLGGKAPLYRIYDTVESIRKAAGRSVPRTLEATVRRTLEDHSSDSDNYRGGPDVFCMPEGRGAGVWALR